MELALKEAKKAYLKKEVPVGAVIVKNDEVIAKAHNLKETKMNVLCHAEIICINKACKKLNNWRLDDCEMYVTLFPCDMCKGAIEQSRISKVYYSCNSNNSASTDKYIQLFDQKTEKILKDFFQELRNE